MDKSKITDVDRMVGEEAPAKKFKQSSDSVWLTFRYNRKFELQIGRGAPIVFLGREKHKVPRSFLEHRDWTPAIAKKFVIQEA